MTTLPLRAASLVWGFLTWWVTELQSAVEYALAWVAPTWSRPVTVFVEDGRVRVYDGAARPQEPILDLACAPWGTDVTEAISAQFAAALGRGRRARMVVDTQKAFIRSLRLPLAALPHLKTAIVLQLPKLMPLDTVELLTDFELVTADASGGVVELAAVKRSDVSSLVSRLHAGGLRVESIHLADGPDAKSRFRFQGAELSGGDSRFHRVDRLLLGIAASLACLCVSVAVVQEYRAQHALAQAQRRLQAGSNAALGRRQLLLGKLEPLSALSEVEATLPAASLLAEVTTLVPHDTWITTLELKDRHLRMVGISSDAAALVKLFAGSPYLAEVALRSAMSVGIGTGKDRFEIVADVRARTP